MKVHPDFKPSQIADSLNYDFNALLNSPAMTSFKEGLRYKSEVTKERDTAAVNALISKLRQYKEGWISCNALKTFKLYQMAEDIDDFYDEIMVFDKWLNTFIKKMVDMGQVPENELAFLRDFEKIKIKMNTILGK